MSVPSTSLSPQISRIPDDQQALQEVPRWNLTYRNKEVRGSFQRREMPAEQQLTLLLASKYFRLAAFKALRGIDQSHRLPLLLSGC
ncbi:hypothetical protein M0657_007188 [Pyricularia oryzae]|nr:hypothetical protein M0657_007188 [Pyricularia oryzae]KAI7925511.1 hypothetical protein M9X92_003285 [Pyricularia oryzae]